MSITAFALIGTAQQSGLSGAQPISGKSVIELDCPAKAKNGWVQLPVNNGRSGKVTADVSEFVYEPGNVSMVVMVDRPLRVEAAFLPVLAVVKAVIVLLPATDVVKPNGEHPTKFGADALTAAHCS